MKTTQKHLVAENTDLRARLDEAEETLRAIRRGEVDALVVPGEGGEQIFTLKGANRPYRVLIEDMSEGALTLTAEGMILYANRRFAGMLKTPLEKVIGSTIHTWIAPDRQKILQALLQKGGDEKRREELVLTASDGTQVPVYLSANRLLPTDETPASFCLVATDLTEQKHTEAIVAAEKLAQAMLAAANQSRHALLSVIEDQKRAEESLRQAEEKYRSIFENAVEGIYQSSIDGHFTSVNSAMTRILGYASPDEVITSIMSVQDQFYADPSRRTTAMQELEQKGTLENFESECLRKDGSRIWISENARGVRDANGTLVHYEGFIQDITERKRAEEALHESEEQFRSTFEQAAVGMAQVAPDGRWLRLNQRLCDIVGYTREELLTKSFQDITHPDDLENDVANLRRMLVNEIQTYAREKRYIRKDGSSVWVNLTVSLVREPTGAPKYFVSVIEEITERKRAEAALRESEEKYRSLVTEISDGIFITDDRGALTFVNPALARIHGFEHPDQLVGRNFEEFIAPPMLNEVARYLRQVVDGEQPQVAITVELVRPDGTQAVVEVKASVKLDGGKVVGTHGVVRDVTERKQAEEALRESEERAQQYLDIAGVMFLVLDADQKVILVNKKGCEILGYVEQEIVGRNWFDHFLPQDEKDRVGAAFDQLMAGEIKPVEYFENAILTKSGQERLVAWHSSVLTDEAGRIVGVVSSGEDITERKRAETQRSRHVEQMLALNEVALTVLQHLDLDELYRAACEELRRFGMVASIYRVTDDGQLRHVYTSMSDELLADYVNHFDGPIDFTLPVAAMPGGRIPAGVSMLDAEMLQGVMQRASLDKHPLVKWLLAHMRNGRMLVVSLTQNSTAIGVFTVVGASLSEIDEPAVALFARQMSAALENALLFTAERERRAELDMLLALSTDLREAQGANEMLAHALRQAMKILHAEAGSVVLRQPDSDRLKFVLAEGHLTSNAGRVIDKEKSIGGIVLRTRQPYVTPDYAVDPNRFDFDQADEIGAAVFVPLQSEVEILGVLTVARDRAPGTKPFSPAEMHLLTTIGEMVGNALRRARLFDDAQRRLKQTQALYSIDTAITSSLDLRLTLSVFLEELTRHLHIDAADILLNNVHSRTLDYASGRGFRTGSLQHTRLRLGEGYAGQAALERRAVSVPDFAGNPDGLTRAPLLASEGFASYIGVPLIAKGAVKGVLEIFHRTPIEPDAEWLDFLNALATEAAIAIDNATLFSDLQRSNDELELAYDTTIEGWSRALDLRDKETEGHTLRVTEITLRLAKAMGIGDAELVHIRRGGLLHDIGKMGVPDSILLKPGPLTDDEWRVMRLHPQLAYAMLSPISYLRPALDIPYCHHEKWDGSGYPRGLKGEQIPFPARIFAIVDVWDALRSDRPYRAAWAEDKVLEHLRSQAGTHFDPQVVKVCLESGVLGT